MKKILLVLAVTTAFVSCEEKNHGKELKNDVEKKEYSNPVASPCFDSTLIPLSDADVLINNYNEYLRNIQKEPLAHSSFMLNAKALREYLNSNPDLATLNVYLAKTDTGMMTDTSMTLVYIGAVDSLGADNITYNVEKPYYKPNEPAVPYLLDHSFPCPVCIDRIKAYKPPTKPSN